MIPYIEWGLCVPAACSAEDVGFGLLDIVEIACKFLGSTDLKYWTGGVLNKGQFVETYCP